jgi:hypothetical protein
VVQSSVTALPLVAERVTVNVAVVVPTSPSLSVTSFTDSRGSGSSSVIVASPEPSVIVAFPGLDKVKPKDSFGSSSTSPFTVTPIVVAVDPAVIVRLPLAVR